MSYERIVFLNYVRPTADRRARREEDEARDRER
jgi:hypothetical protein